MVRLHPYQGINAEITPECGFTRTVKDDTFMSLGVKNKTSMKRLRHPRQKKYTHKQKSRKMYPVAPSPLVQDILERWLGKGYFGKEIIIDSTQSKIKSA